MHCFNPQLMEPPSGSGVGSTHVEYAGFPSFAAILRIDAHAPAAPDGGALG